MMTDLIKRDDAPDPPEYLCTFPSCGCVAKGRWCPAPRSPAAIREAALREAADVLPYGSAYRAIIFALIGEKK